MDTMNTITSRKSVRSYTGEKISQSDLQTILKAANAAPVVMGKYSNYHLTVIENAEVRDAINQKAKELFGAMIKQPDFNLFQGAPTYIVISVVPEDQAKVGGLEYCSAACIVQNMALAATELGIGQCYSWGGATVLGSSPELIKMLKLPENAVPLSGMLLGITNEKYTAREIPDDRITITYLQ